MPLNDAANARAGTRPGQLVLVRQQVRRKGSFESTTMRYMKRTAAALMMLTVASGCGGGEETVDAPLLATTGERETIVVEDAEAYPIDEAAGTYGVYMKITNEGSSVDRLIEAAIDGCGATELQETTDEDGAVAVAPIAGGIVIPPNATLVLGSGAAMVVCLGLPSGASEGDSLEVSLTFEQAGRLTVSAVVRSEP